MYTKSHISNPTPLVGVEGQGSDVALTCGGYNKNINLEITLFSVLRYNDVCSDGHVMHCNDVLCCAVRSGVDCVLTD